MSRSQVTLEDIYLFEIGFYRDEDGKIKKIKKENTVDKKIKSLEKKEKSLLKGTKSLLKADKKHDKVVEKAKKVVKAKAHAKKKK